MAETVKPGPLFRIVLCNQFIPGAMVITAETPEQGCYYGVLQQREILSFERQGDSVVYRYSEWANLHTDMVLG